MRRGVRGGDLETPRLADDLSIAGDHGTERLLARRRTGLGFLDGNAHEMFVIGCHRVPLVLHYSRGRCLFTDFRLRVTVT